MLCCGLCVVSGVGLDGKWLAEYCFYPKLFLFGFRSYYYYFSFFFTAVIIFYFLLVVIVSEIVFVVAIVLSVVVVMMKLWYWWNRGYSFMMFAIECGGN